MNVHQQAIAAMRAITMSREYGSGGGEIAARLAHRLGWQLIDHAVIDQTARELGVYETEVEKHDEEYVASTLSRIVGGIQSFVTSLPTPGAPPGFVSTSPAPEARAYQDTLRQIIIAAGNRGHAIIVGRGGQVLFADPRDVLHIRVVAPLELRVAYVVRREGLDTDAARRRVEAKDRARTRYMQTQFHCQHEDPHLYDLVIDTVVLDLESAVDLICLALERKASRLSVPVEDLGPAVGLVPYTSKPADFRTSGRSSV